MPLSTAYHPVVLNGVFGSSRTASSAATLYAALFTADPGADDSGVEVSGNGYARVSFPNTDASWEVATGSTKALLIDLTWPTATGSWGSPKWVGFYTAATSGTLVASMKFAGGPPSTWPTTLTPLIRAGTLIVSFWDLSA